MRHIAWFDFLGSLIGQKTIKTHCGIRVRYGTHVNDTAQSDCLDCIQHVASNGRFIERLRESGEWFDKSAPTRDDRLYQ